jgi:hypothetical protein
VLYDIVALWTLLRARLEARVIRDEAGYTTEAIVMTALLAGLAIAVGAVIIAKVVSKANSINLN